MDDTDAAIAAAAQEVRNPFPTPPVYWSRYTQENLRLLALLKAREKEAGAQIDPKEPNELVSEEPLVPSFPLTTLEPPKLEWVVEAGEYSSFGEVHSTSDIFQAFPSTIERLGEPSAGGDQRPYLRNYLLSMLSTYHKLLGSLLEPVPEGYHRNPEQPPLNWEHYLLWIRNLGLNFMASVNELRPIQARITLETMMQRQIELRKEETKAIHEKCDSLEKNLKELRTKAAEILLKSVDPTPPEIPSMKVDDGRGPNDENARPNEPLALQLTRDDVLQWAAECT